MKCPLDYCRLQWVNREFFPVGYVFKWERNQSRFGLIFKSEDREGSEESKNDEKTSNPQIALLSNLKGKKKHTEGTTQSAEMNAFQETYRTKNVEICRILSQEDRRTTVMIKNIPNKFTKTFFLNLFTKDFKGKYDLFLLPTDIKDKKNFGYGFINFVNCFHIIHFFSLYNGKPWPNTNSLKVCEIVYSKMQGIKKMLKHYPLKGSQASNNQEKENNEVIEFEHEKMNIVLPLVYIKEFTLTYPDSPFVIASNNMVVLSENIPIFEKGSS